MGFHANVTHEHDHLLDRVQMDFIATQEPVEEGELSRASEIELLNMETGPSQAATQAATQVIPPWLTWD
jgi:hypothetical protein